MKLTIGFILLSLLFAIIFEDVISVQIVEKTNTRSKRDRFDPTWKSLDSRELPIWYKVFI